MDHEELHLERTMQNQEQEIAHRVQLARQQGPAPVWQDGRAYCVDCNEPNDARAARGFGRCLFCQEQAEDREGL